MGTDEFLSREFTRQLLENYAVMQKGDHIIVIDMETHRKLSPAGTISYGFPSLLNLYFAGKTLTGEILRSPAAAVKKIDKNRTLVFPWENNTLII